MYLHTIMLTLSSPCGNFLLHFLFFPLETSDETSVGVFEYAKSWYVLRLVMGGKFDVRSFYREMKKGEITDCYFY